MEVLDFEAVRAIAAQTPDSELIRWVDEALREKSGYTLPPKIHIAQQDGDYYNVMPCIYERGNIAMVKMIGRHSIKRGEDRSSMMGDILLYESDTGILRALMDGEYITCLLYTSGACRGEPRRRAAQRRRGRGAGDGAGLRVHAAAAAEAGLCPGGPPGGSDGGAGLCGSCLLYTSRCV